jgi:hypothetical protein
MLEHFIGFLGVVVGAGIAWFREWWVEKRTRQRQASYLAIRVICILDKFIDECGDFGVDDGGDFGDRVPSPSSPKFPDDVDWKSIDPELAYRIIALPDEVSQIASFLAGLSQVADDYEYSKERQLRFSRLGLKTHHTVENLRQTFGIEQREFG